ncbi:MAG: V-type ATP synthase subunit D [Termitinemataceae bacterium]|nr:MAG: V-type ATP synthase subunit D [Termitinemataceae bacterium]
MAKIKLTKNELKKQKDQLKMFQRYLPTLMLKKQQLQAEIRTVEQKIKGLSEEKIKLDEEFKTWIAVFGEKGVFTPDLLRITKIVAGDGNIAGVPIPVFESVDFEMANYDFLSKPLWLDTAIEKLKKKLSVDMEVRTLEEQQRRLSKELRTTSQRVNLFEKIKIPESRSNIKKIQVYLGDQQTAAVVRGKISKRGMEKAVSA